MKNTITLSIIDVDPTKLTNRLEPDRGYFGLVIGPPFLSYPVVDPFRFYTKPAYALLDWAGKVNQTELER